jgi:hypothetical protein
MPTLVAVDDRTVKKRIHQLSMAVLRLALVWLVPRCPGGGFQMLPAMRVLKPEESNLFNPNQSSNHCAQGWNAKAKMGPVRKNDSDGSNISQMASNVVILLSTKR